MFLRITLVAAVAALGLAANPAAADDSILTVAGPGLPSNGVKMTMAEIEALPQKVFRTTTVWTEGQHEFSGVAVKTLLESAGLKGNEVQARALNAYVATIPMDEITDEAPIIATRIDGQHFPRREKGPLWIVYPYDKDPAYQTDTTYGRSLWQLESLTVN